VEEDKLADRM